MPPVAYPSPREANQCHLLRVEMGPKELFRGEAGCSLSEGPPPQPVACCLLPPAWLSTLDSLLTQGDGEGSWWSTLKRGWLSQLQWGGTNQESHGGGRLRRPPTCREWHTGSADSKCPERLWGAIIQAWTLPASNSFLVNDPAELHARVPTASPTAQALCGAEQPSG